MTHLPLVLVAATLPLLTAPHVKASVPPVTAPDTSSVLAARSGDVTVVDGDHADRPLTKGGSATEFNLRLPAGAECPGDSEHDDWRVQTFIVPADVDPGTLQYTVIGPAGLHQYAIYDKYTQPIVDQNLIANDTAGSPARIDSFFPMSFAVFPPGEIPPGNYRMGVACTWFGATADYWDTELVVSETPDDQPAQLSWRLASAAADAPTSNGHSTRSWLAPTIVTLLAVAGLGALVRARRHRQPPSRFEELT